MRVEADVEVLRSLREALLSFARRQTDILESAGLEIAATTEMLMDAEDYWRSEVERRRTAYYACLAASAQTAAQGLGTSCSSYDHAWHQAEEGLAHTLEWQHRIGEEVSRYRSAAQRYSEILTDRLPRATNFLLNCATALESYYASRVLSTAGALARTGIGSIMGGLIVIIRQTSGELRRVVGSEGEEISAQVLSERFGLQEIPFDQPKHGFDRVFRAPGIPLIVMESKVSSTGELRLGRTQTGEQGSPEWVAATATRMSGRDSAQWSPANELIAQTVQRLGPENVPVITVVVNPESGLADVYVRRGESDWCLLEGDVTLK